MKKIFIILSLLMCLLLVVSCGDDSSDEENTPNKDDIGANTDTNTDTGSIPDISLPPEEEEKYLRYSYEEAEGGYIVSKIETNCNELNIPNSYNGKDVIGIGNRAMMGNTSVKRVVLPETVTYMGQCAFKNCTALKTVTAVGKIEVMEDDVFYGCNALELEKESGCYYLNNWLVSLADKEALEITVREGTTGICAYAFYEASNINTVKLPNSIEIIGAQAFMSCSYLNTINLPENVEEIGMYAFYACSKLKDFQIPASLTKIGASAFGACRGLRYITIPNTVLEIGADAFEGCTYLVLTVEYEQDKLPKGFEEGWNGTSYTEYLTPWGDAPDFVAYDINGNQVKLSDFQGKGIVLNFWASWCPPCKAELPYFEDAYKSYGNDVHFIILNLTTANNETVEAATEYIESEGYTFPVYFDKTGEAGNDYSVYSIPQTYFIDASGNIVSSHEGYMTAEQLLAGINQIK